MSDEFKSLIGTHSNTTELARRSAAVAAALTIIQAKVTNAPTYGSIVADEMENLSKYADQIQEALKVK